MALAARFVVLAFIALAAGPVSATAAGKAPSAPAPTAAKPSLPKVVLYSTSWCPHCKEVRQYLNEHHIPFTDLDVEQNESARNDLTKKYKSQGVPVIVIGNDEKVLKGFQPDTFEKALKEVSSKK